MKTQILATLGEKGLQQASALNVGLTANDRLKYAFSLLQMALEHAQHPEQSAPTLKQERLACGIDDTDLDAAVAGAREAGDAGRTAVLAAGAPFYLGTGQVQSADDEACRADLDFLGSRLVFLIDWNRARKQLRGFLRAADRLALLSWAAEAQIGHRGFLEVGGATVVNRAIEATAGSSMRFGDRLCDVLGATDGVLAAQSHALIQDRVLVALAGHFRNEERQLLGRAAETTLLDEGDLLALDGNTGAVHAGKLDVATERPEVALKAIASWQIATAA